MTLTKLSQFFIGFKTKIINSEFSTIRGRKCTIIETKIPKKYTRYCPCCGKRIKNYYDTRPVFSIRKHSININGDEVYIKAKRNRVDCPNCGVKTEKAPWAHDKSDFTYFFERLVINSLLEKTKSATAKKYKINYRSVGAILSRFNATHKVKLAECFNGLVRIGIDETGIHMNRKFITTIVNHDTKEIIRIKEGKSRDVIDDFFNALNDEQKQSIQAVSGDGAPYIASAVQDHLGDNIFCLDSFHVMQWVNDAYAIVHKKLWNKKLDEAFKNDKSCILNQNLDNQKTPSKYKFTPQYKRKSKYLMLKRGDKVDEAYASIIAKIQIVSPELYNFYYLKESLGKLLHTEDPDVAKKLLEHWCEDAKKSKSASFRAVAKKIKKRIDLIINTIRLKISNGRVEGLNRKIKTTINKCYGFRCVDNLISYVNLICSPIRNYSMYLGPYKTYPH